MNNRTTAFFTLLFLFSFQLFAQDTIQMMNGKHVVAMVIKIDDLFLRYRKHLPVDTGNIVAVEKAEVFSVIYHDGHKSILYQQDTAKGYDFTPEQMNQYILGEEDAFRYSTNAFLSIAGVAAGATAALYLRFWGLPIVPAYSIFLGIIDPKIKSKKVLHTDLIGNKYYTRGYHSVTTRKRAVVGLISSLIGYAVMYGVAPLIN
jgi:hypothetical protein